MGYQGEKMFLKPIIGYITCKKFKRTSLLCQIVAEKVSIKTCLMSVFSFDYLKNKSKLVIYCFETALNVKIL
jgi:hypothetical protein